MAIHVFTDSGADVPPSLANALDIKIVPLTIHFGDRVFQDGVDLAPLEFYAKMKTSPEQPNTSQPSPGEFIEAYRKHTEPGDTIFSFHLSSRLSGTYQSAFLAAKQLTDRSIYVVDTKSASMGIALPAILAARLAKEGAAPEAIHTQCTRLIDSTRIYFLVDTLEYLHRHGRIGKAQALAGSLLNIKPVLCIEDGLVAPADKVRGKARAMARLLELSFRDLKADKRYICAVMDTDGGADGTELVAAVRSRLPEAEVFRSLLGSTIGTHTGPGAIGLIIGVLP